MNVRPILFSALMVRALLAGTKTQTRRIVTPQPVGFWGGTNLHAHTFKGLVNGADGAREHPRDHYWACPYGKPGDLLWVRESLFQFGGPIEYAADSGAPSFKRKMTPSIHMPRWASRLTLRIVDVRVERLHDIEEEDAEAEGVTSEFGSVGADEKPLYVVGFQKLWARINGAGSWAANPWIWALTFSIERLNVDELLRQISTTTKSGGNEDAHSDPAHG